MELNSIQYFHQILKYDNEPQSFTKDAFLGELVKALEFKNNWEMFLEKVNDRIKPTETNIKLAN